MLTDTLIQVAKIESRIVIYDIRIFSTKINMMKLLENNQSSGRCSIKFVPRTDRNDPEHSLLCY